MIVVSTLTALVSEGFARADVFATLGLFLGFASGAMPNRRAILRVAAACSACFALHFLRLGALTGGAMCVLSVLQSLAAAESGSQRPAWFAPFFAASASLVLGLTAVTWAGWPSAFAGIGALLALRARLHTDEGAMRLTFIGSSLAWAGHNLCVASPLALTCDCLTLAGLSVALMRARRVKAFAV